MGIEETMTALEFAIKAHSGQQYGNQPYGVHLRHVVEVLRRFGYDNPDFIDAAYLHDVVEDTTCTIMEIESQFGNAGGCSCRNGDQ